MKEPKEHLGTLVLGYMWNQPLQQLNSLLAGEHRDRMSPELLAALQKLSTTERKALKSAITSIFADEISHFFIALDEANRRGETMEITRGEEFSRHLPPWEDHISYFDKDGNPKLAAAAA